MAGRLLRTTARRRVRVLRAGKARRDARRRALVFAGNVVDAYLQRAAIQRGYSVVVWRGRHVVEPTELAPDEAALFWTELLRVGQALIDCLEPVKLNYNVLGNSVPHLHAHVIPRYAVDPRPEWPFPFPEEDPPPFPEEELRADVERLRSGQLRWTPIVIEPI